MRPPDNGHEPTLGEVYRLLLSMQTSMERMASDARADRDQAANTYVRKDVLEPKLGEVRDDIKELKGNWSTQQDRNRQIFISIIAGAVVLAIGIVLAALGLPAGGGV